VLKKIFLTADETNFLNPAAGFFIPGFIPSIPKDEVPLIVRYPIERFLFYRIPYKRDGEIFHCAYGLRKIEAILLNAGLDCKVYSPQVIEKFSDNAALFGVYCMDPLGIGPVTSTLQGIFGDRRYNIYGDPNYYEPPYTHLKFKKLIEKLKRFNLPILVGGPGASQFDMLPMAQEELGIDCVVVGDCELEGPEIFRKALAGKKLPKIIHCKPIPQNVEIPTIIKPVSWGLVEISRGCDRKCKFCEPSASKQFRWLPLSQIIKEIKINLRICSEICLMSEDVFRYGTESRQWVPDWGLINLIREIKKLPGLKSIALSHACLASALAAPDQIEALREELNLSKENYSAVQPGIETGSIRIVKEFMPYKAAPYDPEQWHDIILEGWKLLTKNYIYPAATLMIGLNDTEEDIQETISLMKKIMRYPGMFWPLFFSSLGTLKERHRFFVDWTQMSPSAHELYLLAIKYMLKQHEKMHQHLFGTSILGRSFNHFTATVGKTFIDRVESGKYSKGTKEIQTFGKLFLKNFVHHTSDNLKMTLKGYKTEFHGAVKA
jgi:radical SAM superfamily enzyme YgiQ (UPF0313 family)